MIAISRGPGGLPAGGQPAAPRNVASVPAGSGNAARIDLTVRVAAENVAAKRTAAQFLSEGAQPGAQLDREV